LGGGLCGELQELACTLKNIQFVVVDTDRNPVREATWLHDLFNFSSQHSETPFKHCAVARYRMCVEITLNRESAQRLATLVIDLYCCAPHCATVDIWVC
jgi:hypothetical protein